MQVVQPFDKHAAGKFFESNANCDSKGNSESEVCDVVCNCQGDSGKCWQSRDHARGDPTTYERQYRKVYKSLPPIVSSALANLAEGAERIGKQGRAVTNDDHTKQHSDAV